ncbi:unnamed protein product [Leptosia nina]|uniref:Uncharacterized protein n=1 Tax=Leptosia nina TaxID=320188 RepID=A0AAV1JPA4_9NEOP
MAPCSTKSNLTLGLRLRIDVRREAGNLCPHGRKRKPGALRRRLCVDRRRSTSCASAVRAPRPRHVGESSGARRAALAREYRAHDPAQERRRLGVVPARGRVVVGARCGRVEDVLEVSGRCA